MALVYRGREDDTASSNAAGVERPRAIGALFVLLAQQVGAGSGEGDGARAALAIPLDKGIIEGPAPPIGSRIRIYRRGQMLCVDAYSTDQATHKTLRGVGDGGRRGIAIQCACGADEAQDDGRHHRRMAQHGPPSECGVVRSFLWVEAEGDGPRVVSEAVCGEGRMLGFCLGRPVVYLVARGQAATIAQGCLPGRARLAGLCVVYPATAACSLHQRRRRIEIQAKPCRGHAILIAGFCGSIERVGQPSRRQTAIGSV